MVTFINKIAWPIDRGSGQLLFVLFIFCTLSDLLI